MSSLAALLQKTHIEDDEEILQAAETALKQSKNDVDAQCARIVALIKLDRYADALTAVEAGGAALRDKVALEHAYTLYKSGQSAAAAEAAQQGSSRALRHVEAQASYRAEGFARAAELYKGLSSTPPASEVADLRINSGAVDAQLQWDGRSDAVQKKKPDGVDFEAFETAYNAACGSIARGELGQSEVLLKRAKSLCDSLEDLSDHEKAVELLPIIAQQIYVLLKLGRLQEAEALSQSLDIKLNPDASTRHIAEVNHVSSTTRNGNSFLTQRVLSQNTTSFGPDHPFKFQSAILQSNKYALSLQSLKFTGTATSTASKIHDQPLPSLDAFQTELAVVNAAAHARNQVGREALKHILPVLEKRPSDVGLVLTIVQLYVLTGNVASAISLLDTFFARLQQSTAAEKGVRFAPGLVATFVSLCKSQGRQSQVRLELAKAGSYWLRHSTDRSKGVVHLLKHAGSVLLSSQDSDHVQLARDIFTDLHGRDPQDVYAAAGLLAASPDDAADQAAVKLTSIEGLVEDLDIDDLESAGIAQPSSAKQATVTVRKRAAEDAKPTRPKKMRKNRIPKDFDPSKKPDPERWLPLRDRSTYRPKGKKGKARQALLSQGAVASEGEASRPATPGSEVIKQKQGGGGSGGVNKKKKGKKW